MNIAEGNVRGVVAPRWIKSVVEVNVEKRDNLSAFESCAEVADDRSLVINSQETRNIIHI